MGSGTGSDALAGLYPELEVIGVDIDQTMVDLATERYRRKQPALRGRGHRGGGVRGRERSTRSSTRRCCTT